MAEAVQPAVGRFVDELARLHDDDLGLDAEIVAQLGLELDRDEARLGQIAAEHVAKEDLGLEAVRMTGLGQERLRLGEIEVVPRLAFAAVVDRARREVRRDLRTGGEEVVDDALAVDAHRHGLAHPDVVERLEGVRHRQIQDVGVGHRDERQFRIFLYRIVIVGARVRDLVDRAGAQLDEPAGARFRPADDERLERRLVAPIAVEALEDDAVAARPLLELPGPGADRVVEDRAAASIIFKRPNSLRSA